ncbi:hypothetical protein ANO14919_048710 [Xylariales sp. No.14919]|nr:hypothetical protein ANO14919_048710 [Xylariales sp. No.14919]
MNQPQANRGSQAVHEIPHEEEAHKSSKRIHSSAAAAILGYEHKRAKRARDLASY